MHIVLHGFLHLCSLVLPSTQTAEGNVTRLRVCVEDEMVLSRLRFKEGTPVHRLLQRRAFNVQ